MPTIVIQRRRVVALLAAISCLLAAAGAGVGLASRWMELPDVPGDTLLDLRGEGNLPAYWSTALLLLAGLCLLGVGQAEASRDRRQARAWRALGVIFLYLSADECAQLHELARRIPQSALPDSPLFYWPWVLFGGAAVIVLGMAFWRFLWALPPDTRRNLLLAGALYVGGALGLELLGATIEHQRWSEGLLVLEETAEELLEMLGVVCLLHGLLCHLSRHLPPVTLQVEPTESCRVEPEVN
jgi:drug/metabolite transporter (DMT)-like permease